MHKVVAHFQDGSVVKGTTTDFTPNKDRFHIFDESAPPGARERDVFVPSLKGLYFVRDLDGDLGHAKSNIFELQDMTPGRRIRVRFKDGETMNGVTQGYQPGRTAFWVVPADRKSNTERAYIITSAAADITFL
jgi:hypothetical protein